MIMKIFKKFKMLHFVILALGIFVLVSQSNNSQPSMKESLPSVQSRQEKMEISLDLIGELQSLNHDYVYPEIWNGRISYLRPEGFVKEGEIVGLDIGLWLEGLCTDMAVTVPVGEVKPELIELMRVTRESLMKGVEAAKVGDAIKDISRAIEGHIKPHGYGIVRALVGHGVGHQVHEAPHVPNFVSPRYPHIEIQEGMCLALEPMVGLGGDHKVDTAPDGWSIVLADGSPGAHFEVTIAVTKEGGAEILTPLPV